MLNDKNDLPMKVATFRFGVIADFVTGTRLGYGDKERVIWHAALDRRRHYFQK